MYSKFFGFRERPFKLVPDPHYLYLSKSHEEALAHLTYAVSQGDGFLAITGEVGTGKTTLCRAFIQSLDQDKVVAYIFNPKLDALQLLRAINDEFEIPSNFDNTKDLIDTLNRFLIEKKQEGKTVILLIDEAQNLRKSVLEQIRLLSNLETAKDKLLQIILVGQPELMDILEARELRQLAQRITLNYHLMPFDAVDVGRYIDHRIHLASQKPKVSFSKDAVKIIHRYSNGTPRIINMVCDRALLTACILEKNRITGPIVSTAIRELSGKGKVPAKLPLISKIVIALLACCVAVLAVERFYPEITGWPPLAFLAASNPPETPAPEKAPPKEPAPVKTPERLENTENISPVQAPVPEPAPTPEQGATLVPTDIPNITTPEPDPAPAETLPMADPVVNALPAQEKAPENPATTLALAESKEPPGMPAVSPSPAAEPEGMAFEDYLKNVDVLNSRQAALNTVLSLWNTGNPPTGPEFASVEDDGSFFVMASRRNGFDLHTLKNNVDLAKRMNLPFIQEIYWPEKMALVYLAVTGVENGRISLKGKPGEPGIVLAFSDLKKYLGETSYILWKNYYGYDGMIPGSAPPETILTLKMQLRDMGYSDIAIHGGYDDQTRTIIQTLQNKYQIKPDGLVGPLTKIALYNETASLNIPHISN
jgi:general secretion pathway protein A